MQSCDGREEQRGAPGDDASKPATRPSSPGLAYVRPANDRDHVHRARLGTKAGVSSLVCVAVGIAALAVPFLFAHVGAAPLAVGDSFIFCRALAIAAAGIGATRAGEALRNELPGRGPLLTGLILNVLVMAAVGVLTVMSW